MTTMGKSLIALEGHLSSMMESSSKATRVAELLALESHKYVLLVAGLTEMKKNDDNDAAEKKEKLNTKKQVALDRWCKKKNVADAAKGGRAASETTADKWDEMTDAKDMTGEIAADKERLVKAKAAGEAVAEAKAEAAAEAAKAKTAAETKEAAAVAKATADARER